jgi:transposase
MDEFHPVSEGGMDPCPSNLPTDGHSFRRIEVLTGTARRRRWSEAEKAQIVSESLAPGAVASAIALRYGLHRNQLYAWRKQLRAAAAAAAAAAADAGTVATGFVPIMVLTDAADAADAAAAAVASTVRTAPADAAIEIDVAGAIVRATPGSDLAFLAEVVRLLKRLA